MTIRAVLFDFGGVFTLSPFEAIRQAADELGADADELSALVFGPYDQDTDHPWHRVERGELSLAAYQEQVGAALRAAGHDLEPFEVLARLGSGGSEGRTIRDDVVEVVREVRSEGRATAIVTNNAAELRELWRQLLPVDELFDLVVDSSEVGVRKPDPRIFELTLERLGAIDPGEAVFLDDHPGNVRAARAVGLTAIHVEPDHRPAMADLRALLRTR